LDQGWTLIEACCGGAALTLHLCGARRALLPYQGGKWRFRHELQAALADAGFAPPPRRVELTDPGPWGIVAGAVLRASTRAGIIDHLALLARMDARAVFDALQGQPVPEDPIAFSVQYLFLQRLSFSGKAVGTRGGVWRSPGFNVSSAYGVAATDRFGDVLPMIPSLLKTLRSYTSVVEPERLSAARAPARLPDGPCTEPTAVYIDPPYAGSTDYPDAGLDRPAVVALAQAWAEAGATVFVSEAEALPELLAKGWDKRAIYAGRGDTSPFRGKQEEWLTVSPKARIRRKLRKTMPTPAEQIAAWLDSLTPDVRARVEALRVLVGAAVPSATEDFAWKSSSFRVSEQHFATINARGPKGTVLLVLHRGAKPKVTPPLDIPDPTKRLMWKDADRAVVAFADVSAVDASAADLTPILAAWAAQA
jgi:hypothetical protein